MLLPRLEMLCDLVQEMVQYSPYSLVQDLLVLLPCAGSICWGGHVFAKAEAIERRLK